MSYWLDKFIQSMTIAPNDRSDGVGYDVAAVAHLTMAEKLVVEDLLAQKADWDWRDLEALGRLGTPKAISLLERAAQSGFRNEVRVAAIGNLALIGCVGAEEVEAMLTTILPTTSVSNGLMPALRLLLQYPSERVKKVLLWCAENGADPYLRYYAGVELLMMGGLVADYYSQTVPVWLSGLSSEAAADRQRSIDKLKDAIHGHEDVGG